MTIDISANNPRISYSVAAGVTQTSFAVPFEFFDDSDLNVYIDTTLQTITTNYTVTGGAGSTGTVTMSVTGPKTVIFTRDTTIERTTDFTAGVDINRAALNTQLDTLTAISADNKDLGERSIRIADYDPAASNLLLPDAATRADKLLSFDTEGDIQVQAASDLLTGSVLGANYTKASHTGDGTTVAFSTTEAAGSKNNIQVYIDGVYQNKDTFSISGSMLTFSEAPPLNSAIEFIVGNAVTSISGDATAITYNQGGTGAVDRTTRSKLQEFVSVKDFGADPTGALEASTAIQAAIDSGAASIYIPAGTYKVTSQINCSRDIKIYGDGSSTVLNTRNFVSGSAAFNFTGAGKTDLETITATFNAGQKGYTFASAPSVSVGDVIALYDNTDFSYSEERSYYKKGEFLTVKEIDGNTVYFNAGSYDTYTSGSIFAKMDMISVDVQDLNIEAEADNCPSYGLYFASCKKNTIKNVNILDGGGYAGFAIFRSFDTRMSQCIAVISDFLSPNVNAYPILVANSQDVKVNQCTAESPWHAMSTGGGSTAPAIVCRGIIGTESSFTSHRGIFAADFHGNTEHSGYYNCTLKGSGCTTGGNYNSFIGNTIYTHPYTTVTGKGTVGESALCFYSSEPTGYNLNIADNIVEISGWYGTSDFGQFVEFAMSNTTSLTGSMNITNNNVVLLGETSTTDNYVLKVVCGNYDDVRDVVSVNISGNSIISKKPAETDGYDVIYIYAGNDALLAQYRSVNVNNNILHNVGIRILGGGTTTVSGNTITDAYEGVLTSNSGPVLLANNNIRNCYSRGAHLRSHRKGFNATGNIFYENNAGNTLSGSEKSELYIENLDATVGGLVSGNLFHSTSNVLYPLSGTDWENCVENNNVFTGDFGTQAVYIPVTLSGPEASLSHHSSATERELQVNGNAWEDVAVLTFDNASWGAISLVVDYATDVNGYGGQLTANIEGYALIANTQKSGYVYSSTNDPENNIIKFIPSGNTMTIQARATGSSGAFRGRFKMVRGARREDLGLINIAWQ